MIIKPRRNAGAYYFTSLNTFLHLTCTHAREVGEACVRMFKRKWQCGRYDEVFEKLCVHMLGMVGELVYMMGMRLRLGTAYVANLQRNDRLATLDSSTH